MTRKNSCTSSGEDLVKTIAIFIVGKEGVVTGIGKIGKKPLSNAIDRDPPQADISISLEHAWVDFPIFDAKRRSLKKALLSSVGGVIKENSAHTVTVSALSDISLFLQEGDRVGLIGHNGAGKSTLLRVLSGIYEPTRGSATIRGRVAPVFDLGIGMDPEISGFENIIIRGLFLGQTRKQMLKKVDDIAEFSELGNFLSMPLRTYSAGMRIRLALGVVTSIDPEILLLDEGIGAIDADFMTKARDRLQELVNRSGLLVFASHSQDFLAQLCDEAIWLEHGRIITRGPLAKVIAEYEGNTIPCSHADNNDSPQLAITSAQQQIIVPNFFPAHGAENHRATDNKPHLS